MDAAALKHGLCIFILFHRLVFQLRACATNNCRQGVKCQLTAIVMEWGWEGLREALRNAKTEENLVWTLDAYYLETRRVISKD